MQTIKPCVSSHTRMQEGGPRPSALGGAALWKLLLGDLHGEATTRGREGGGACAQGRADVVSVQYICVASHCCFPFLGWTGSRRYSPATRRLVHAAEPTAPPSVAKVARSGNPLFGGPIPFHDTDSRGALSDMEIYGITGEGDRGRGGGGVPQVQVYGYRRRAAHCAPLRVSLPATAGCSIHFSLIQLK